MTSYPDSVVLHIPHSSTEVPESVRGQFILSDDELAVELYKMTDHHTLEMFAASVSAQHVVASSVSRLVVDVERFEDDSQEPMVSKGMGVIYTLTSDGNRLRRKISPEERDDLLHHFYRPHHARLTASVDERLAMYGQCLVIDCHSFPSSPLSYEFDQRVDRPDICIGTDSYHTPDCAVKAFVITYEAAGFQVKVNAPFSGAIVPLKHYRIDRRVAAVMIEVNRGIYLNRDGTPLPPGRMNTIRELAKTASEIAVTAIRDKLGSV